MTMADDAIPNSLEAEPSFAAAPEPVRVLNALLRGEIAAAETYRIAIEHAASDDTSNDASVLHSIHQEHLEMAQMLRDRIISLGGEPADSSGLWGVWAKLAEGVSSLFGRSPSLQILRDGEAHGLSEYEQSVAEPAIQSLDVASASLIEQHAVPAQQRHIESLTGLLG